MLLVTFALSSTILKAQSDVDNDVFINLEGVVRDAKTKAPLPYTNIYLPKSRIGTISNEVGSFLLQVPKKFSNDSVQFHFIGYEELMISIPDIKKQKVIYLYENIFDLSEIVIYGKTPDARTIVEKILENRDKNYKTVSSYKKVFARQHITNEIMNLDIKVKKNNVKGLEKDKLKMINRSIPKKSVSEIDFLVHFYKSSKAPDSISIKIRPIRIVKLKDRNHDNLENIEKRFNDVLSNTGEKTYWKIKSGIFSQKIDLSDSNISIMDSLKDDKIKINYFKMNLNRWVSFASFRDEKQWDFLYNTGRYNYSVLGGTRLNNEDVYVINFNPKKRGLYIGKLYVSTSTFALIRADFSFAPSKEGLSFSLLGIVYKENQFDGSVSFEKKNERYALKYLSYKSGNEFGFNRNVSLIKKRDQFLFDRKKEQIKLFVNTTNQSETSVEVMVFDESSISESFYNNVQERKFMDVQYVDHFDCSIWKGYSVVKPIESMKDLR